MTSDSRWKKATGGSSLGVVLHTQQHTHTACPSPHVPHVHPSSGADADTTAVRQVSLTNHSHIIPTTPLGSYTEDSVYMCLWRLFSAEIKTKFWNISHIHMQMLLD